jgi:hypothetical protein
MFMYKNILVTLDSCGQSESVLAQLPQLVWKTGTTVHLLSVGFDHGVGHPLLILCPGKAPNY